jgi:hypothetical protein
MVSILYCGSVRWKQLSAPPRQHHSST